MGVAETFKNTETWKILVTFLVAMTPVAELRAAIPLGVSLGLPHWEAMAVSFFGNLLPAPFIIVFIRRIFAWMRRRMPRLEGFVERMEQKGEARKDMILRYSFWGLLLLVAIPLPGTGAWTGALVAALLDMRLKKAMPSIAMGVLIAAILVTGITYGFTEIL